MKTIGRLLSCGITLLLLSGCQGDRPNYADADENLLRRELSLSDKAQLTSYSTNYPNGTGSIFGREGLRIIAVFQFEGDSLEQYRQTFHPDEWKPTPIPSDLMALRDGLEELKTVKGKTYYFADTSSGKKGHSYQSDGIPENMGYFHVVVAAPETSTLHVISKSYF